MNYVVKDTSLTAVADAIRTKSGGNGQLEFPSGFVSEIEGIEKGYTLEDMLPLDQNISGDLVYTGTRIRPFAFYKNTKITSFTGNNVTTMSCVETPAVYTFFECTNLETVILPKITDWDRTDYAFSGCTKLKTIDIDFLNITKTASYMFNNCIAITKTTYVLPKLVSNIWANTLTNNPNVIAFDIESSNTSGTAGLNTNCFARDSNLNIIIIRSTNRIRTLQNINVFTGTPFASGGTGGTLYVPNNLIASYQSATNWSRILGYANNQIKSIESTHTDPNAEIDLTTHYIDGTLIPTS